MKLSYGEEMLQKFMIKLFVFVYYQQVAVIKAYHYFYQNLFLKAFQKYEVQAGKTGSQSQMEKKTRMKTDKVHGMY